MKLRTRVAVATALATAAAVVVVSLVAWVSANRSLRNTVDDQLDERAAALDPGQGRRRGPFLIGEVNIQYIDDDGTVLQFGELSIDVNAEDVDVATSGEGKVRRDAVAVTSDGDELRVRILTVPFRVDLGRGDDGPGRGPPLVSGAVMLARPLAEIEESLDRLRVALIVLSVAGVAGAAVLGWLIGWRSVRPVVALTDAAEEVARTRALDTEISVQRDDELGSLARSFNSMLAALHESKQQQERLIYDASHELRTPLTSLRTNVELLQRAEQMPPEQRRPVLDDVLSELDELTSLVTELVELATDQHRAEDAETIELGSLAEMVVDRHRRRSGVEIELDADDSEVSGVPGLIERAISNLVENALKFSPADGRVLVTVSNGTIEVSDEGPGIEPSDRAAVFERFWRSPQARTLPGSGLGLSIVQRVAQSHGGTVAVVDGRLGGATLRLELPSS